MKQDKSGQIIRYIEVKTLTGKWGEGGVGITEHQLEFAQKHKDKSVVIYCRRYKY